MTPYRILDEANVALPVCKRKHCMDAESQKIDTCSPCGGFYKQGHVTLLKRNTTVSQKEWEDREAYGTIYPDMLRKAMELLGLNEKHLEHNARHPDHGCLVAAAAVAQKEVDPVKASKSKSKRKRAVEEEEVAAAVVAEEDEVVEKVAAAEVVQKASKRKTEMQNLTSTHLGDGGYWVLDAVEASKSKRKRKRKRAVEEEEEEDDEDEVVEKVAALTVLTPHLAALAAL